MRNTHDKSGESRAQYRSWRRSFSLNASHLLQFNRGAKNSSRPTSEPGKKATDRASSRDDDTESVVAHDRQAGAESGLTLTPIAAYFGAKAQIQKAQIDHGLKAFQASNGRLPTSHDEFMKAIIKPAKIKLPKLRSSRMRKSTLSAVGGLLT